MAASTKSRFTTTDVKTMVRDLRITLLGQRVSNVYDINKKTYLFKFAVPGKASKDILLMESGVRFHTTKFVRDKTDSPSVFSKKLRSYIRHKRLEGIRQIGSDRVVDFKFGSGDSVAHVILELYASGNMILTDGAFQIIAALRSHEFEEGVTINVGEIYPIAFTTTLSSDHSNNVLNMSPLDMLKWAVEAQKAYSENQLKNKKPSESIASGNAISSGKKEKKTKKMVIRQLFLSNDSGISFLGPEIIDHCLHFVGIKPSSSVSDLIGDSDGLDPSVNHSKKLELFSRVQDELRNGIQLLQLLDNSSTTPGYIISTKIQSAECGDAKESSGEFVDFLPYLFEQHRDKNVIQFNSFAEAVDEYFCKVEEQRLDRLAQSAEEAAYKKIEKTKTDQANMLRSLAQQQVLLEAQAAAIEAHSVEVEKVRMVINSALSSKISWHDIAEMVKHETAARNPIASLIMKMDLSKEKVTLRFQNELFDPSVEGIRVEPEPEEHIPILLPEKASMKKNGSKKSQDTQSWKDLTQETYLEVTIDLTESAFNNARALYLERATLRAKEEKAAASSGFVIKKVEEQVLKTLETQKLKRNLLSIRKVHWFEKFLWFVSSEGYLVLSGRDALQSDMIVKKYLRPGDIYVHADSAAAMPCIIRNKYSNRVLDDGPVAAPRNISPFAIQEAGTMTVCRSAAWSAKVVISAWWVFAEEVSKLSPHGDTLPIGVFAITGRKNFLPPSTLEMGFGILFRVDELSASRHTQDRLDKLGDQDDETMSMLSEAADRYGLDLSLSAGKYSEIRNSAGSITPALDTLFESDPPNKKALGGNKQNSVKQKNVDSPKKIEGKSKKDVATGNSNNTRVTEAPGIIKKKATTKKKNKKYAEQDEEDFELAMRALGLKKAGDKNKSEEIAIEKKKADVIKRQKNAGIGLLNEDWNVVLSPLSVEIRSIIQGMVQDNVMVEGEIDSFEITTLSSFSMEIAKNILTDFRSELMGRDVKNKTGFLAGIMRRYAKLNKIKVNRDEAQETDHHVDTYEPRMMADSNIVSDVAAEDIKVDILDGIDDDDDNEAVEVEDLSSLVSLPTSEDTVLYAISVCAPYTCFKNYKYKMKLTPGIMKKGKVAKQAQEVFTRLKECSPQERSAIGALGQPEMTANLIGDVKISMPGLQAVQKLQKNESKKKKSK